MGSVLLGVEERERENEKKRKGEREFPKDVETATRETSKQRGHSWETEGRSSTRSQRQPRRGTLSHLRGSDSLQATLRPEWLHWSNAH